MRPFLIIVAGHIVPNNAPTITDEICFQNAQFCRQRVSQSLVDEQNYFSTRLDRGEIDPSEDIFCVHVIFVALANDHIGICKAPSVEICDEQRPIGVPPEPAFQSCLLPRKCPGQFYLGRRDAVGCSHHG